MDYTTLRARLEAANSQTELYDSIVNAPFDDRVETAFLFLGIIVLLVVNKKTGMIDRVALSNTELAKNTTTVSVLPFHDIKIPLDNPDNIISIAIQTQARQDTTDWNKLFTPALSADEARLNQASGGIAYSAVYPLKGCKNGAALIFSYYQYPHEIGERQHRFMEAYSELCSDVLGRFKRKR